MRHAISTCASLRASKDPLSLFGTLRNYTEWLVRVTAVEARWRHVNVPGFELADPRELCTLFRVHQGSAECQPREIVVDEVNGYCDADDDEWKALEQTLV
jgi:hypothetical protein